MNTERLHVIAKAIKQDLQQTRTVTTLQNIVSALEDQISSPQSPEHQQKVSENLEILLKELETAPSNEFNPTWRQVVVELGADGLLGKALKEKIESIFARNQITPSVALTELGEISEQVSFFSSTLDRLIKAFVDLGIGVEKLEPGESEVGVLVPRNYVNNHLEDFAKELDELDKIFKVFAEVSTGARPDFEINTISSSELTVYLAAIAPIAACIAVGIERIVALYKQLLEIRKIRNDLEKYELEKEGLKVIDDSAKKKMEGGIEKIVKDLLDEFYSFDNDGRKNELSIELRYALRKLANRIDRGFNIEVRVEPLDEHIEEESGQAAKDKKYVEAIQAASASLQFLKLEGKPILRLSESNPKKSNKTDKDAKDTK